jgi:hypothetical protein
MNIRKQLVIAWVQDETTKQDQFVIVHSREPTDSDLDTALEQFEAGRAVDNAWTPVVFLDPALDTQQMRSWLHAEALRRLSST